MVVSYFIFDRNENQWTRCTIASSFSLSGHRNIGSIHFYIDNIYSFWDLLLKHGVLINYTKMLFFTIVDIKLYAIFY